jgi:hypothetical protein
MAIFKLGRLRVETGQYRLRHRNNLWIAERCCAAVLAAER